MSYAATIREIDFSIPAARLDEAYRLMIALNDDDGAKDGGRWPEGNKPRPQGLDHHPDRWYPGLEPDYPRTLHSAEAIFDRLGFEVVERYLEGGGIGDLRLTGFSEDHGAEDIFLAAVAPLVRPGSYIVWEGEDGAIWRNSFDGSTMRSRAGRVDEMTLRIAGQLSHYTNAQRLSGELGGAGRLVSATELTVLGDAGQARLRILGDAPALPLNVDVDDVAVIMTIQLRWPERD